MAGLGTINVNLEPTEELRAFIRAIVRQELASALEEISAHKDEAPIRESAGETLPVVEKKTSIIAKRKR